MTDFTFNAQRAEPSLGLQDFNARYFSPKIGRFLTPDSIVPDYSNPQDLNRYSFVQNNPLRYTDPTGHICVPCLIGLVAVAWLAMYAEVGDEAPPHDPVQMYTRGAKEAFKWGGESFGDAYTLVEEYPENVGSNMVALGAVGIPGPAIRGVTKYAPVYAKAVGNFVTKAIAKNGNNTYSVFWTAMAKVGDADVNVANNLLLFHADDGVSGMLRVGTGKIPELGNRSTFRLFDIETLGEGEASEALFRAAAQESVGREYYEMFGYATTENGKNLARRLGGTPMGDKGGFYWDQEAIKALLGD